MEATEYGVRFRKLPPQFGGGVADKVVAPGEVAFVFPWDSIYRFDTSLRRLSWGAHGKGSDPRSQDYVHKGC